MDRQRCVTVCNLLHLPCTFLSPYSLYQVSSLRIPPDIQDLLTVQSAKIEKKERKKKKERKMGGRNGGVPRCTFYYTIKKLSASDFSLISVREKQTSLIFRIGYFSFRNDSLSKVPRSTQLSGLQHFFNQGARAILIIHNFETTKW